MELKPELSPSAVPRAGSNLRATSNAAAEADSNAAAVIFNGAAVAGFSVAAAINAPAAGVAAVSALAVERVAAEVGVAEDDALDRRPGATMSVSLTIRTLLVVVGLALNSNFFSHCWQLTRTAIAAPAVIKQESFATPDDALKAVVDDLKSNDLLALLKIFGPTIEPILNSGDPVADQNARERFVAAAEENHHFDGSRDTLTLVIGKDNWPFPIPLKKADDRWLFDTPAGKEEILDRRIGENELSTIQTVLAYVDAQIDYAELQRQRSGTPEYAQHILSSPGKMDGLYWPAAEGQPQSPLGPLVAAARAAGYRRSAKAEEPAPYHGYFYKVLTGQGPNAPGGAADFIVNGRMIGGFGLVAWPARYGDSGVMTFMVNHDGVVYQKNLGPQTAKIAPKIGRFDPDSTWQKVEP
jgi:hypothetical protein